MLRKLIGSVRFIHAFHRLIEDPTRLDVVFELGRRAISGPSLPPELVRPGVAEYLRARPPALAIDLDALRALPEGTLGRVFADWLAAHGFMPNELVERGHDHGDTEVERYRMHLQSTHDLWHVLTGFETDLDGEVGLQAFYLAQLNTPLSPIVIAAAMLGGLRDRTVDLARTMDAIARGWRMGKEARPLFGVDWAALWSTPLAEVRAHFGLAPEAAATAAPARDAAPAALAA